MILLSNTTDQTINPGQALTFNVIVISSRCNNNESHRINGGDITVKRSCGVYNIEFSANVGSTEAGGVAQLAIYQGNSPLPETTMISTTAAAGDLNNVKAATFVRPVQCCETFTVVNIGTTPINVGANPNFRANRLG